MPAEAHPLSRIAAGKKRLPNCAATPSEARSRSGRAAVKLHALVSLHGTPPGHKIRSDQIRSDQISSTVPSRGGHSLSYLILVLYILARGVSFFYPLINYPGFKE